MGKHIEAIKRQENLSPQEVMASFIWNKAVNSRDHFFSIPFTGSRFYCEYCDDNYAFRIDVYYRKQEQSFALIQPNWNQVLTASKQILDWIQTVIANTVPPVLVKRKEKRRGSTCQQNPQSVMTPGATRQG